MPGKKPFVRRFGQVDFDSMIALQGAAADDADIFVTRRGAFGANRTLTRAQIVAGAGVVPDPLLLNDGTALAPTYSFSADPDSGMFRLGANQLAFAVNGVGQWIINPTELTAVVAGGPLLRNFDSTATVPNIISDSGDVNTGIGNAGPDILSFIAGGVQIAQAKEAVGANQFIIAPGVFQNNAAAPSLAFGTGNTGFFETSDNVIDVSIAGTAKYRFSTTFSGIFQGFDLLPTDGSLTVPVYRFANDNNTGIGHDTDALSLVAGGLKCMSVSEVAGARRIGFYDGSPIALQTGVAVTTSAVHAALVALRLITA